MKSDEQILAELARASEGLLLMSESDYPFETVLVEGPPTPARLREMAGAGAQARVEARAFGDFFAHATAARLPSHEGGRAEPASLHAVLRALAENLEDLVVYRVGEINIPVYILGRSPSGNWLGLSTRVVET